MKTSPKNFKIEIKNIYLQIEDKNLNEFLLNKLIFQNKIFAQNSQNIDNNLLINYWIKFPKIKIKLFSISLENLKINIGKPL